MGHPLNPMGGPPGPPPPPNPPVGVQGPVRNVAQDPRGGMTLRELGQFVQDCYRRDLDPDTTTIHAERIGMIAAQVRVLRAEPNGT